MRHWGNSSPLPREDRKSVNMNPPTEELPKPPSVEYVPRAQTPMGGNYSTTENDRENIADWNESYSDLLTQLDFTQSLPASDAGSLALKAESIRFPKPGNRHEYYYNVLSEEFDTLSRKWKRETGFHSSLTLKFMHPSYQRIIAMGRAALPLILGELQQRPGHWFYALRFIAGKEGEEVPNADNIDDARSAWLEWGYRHRYI